MPTKYKKFLQAVVVLVAVGLVWQFGIKPRMKLFESWSGVVKEHYILYGQSTLGTHQPVDAGESRNYFLKIVCDDGTVRDESLPPRLWQSMPDGARVVKESGARFPVVVYDDIPQPPAEAPAEAPKDEPQAPAPDSAPAGE